MTSAASSERLTVPLDGNPFERSAVPLEEKTSTSPRPITASWREEEPLHPLLRADRDELEVKPIRSVYDVASVPAIDDHPGIKPAYLPDRFYWKTVEVGTNPDGTIARKRVQLTIEESTELRKTTRFKLHYRVFSNVEVTDASMLYLPSEECFLALEFNNCEFYENFREVMKSFPIASVVFRRCNFTDSHSFDGPAFGRDVRRVEFIDCTATSVESMRGMFSNQCRLHRVVFRNNHFPLLRNINGMFRMCNALKDLSGLYDFDVSNVKSARGLFYARDRLENLFGLEGWNTREFEDIDEFAYECGSLSDLSALRKWDVMALESACAAFMGAYKLESLADIANWRPKRLVCAANMFHGTRLTSCVALCKWNLPNLIIADRMFSKTKIWNLEGLEHLIGGSVCSTIRMFDLCQHLSDVTAMRDWDVSGVVDASMMFSFCDLKEFDMSILKKFTNLVNAEAMFSSTKMQYADNVEVLAEMTQTMNVKYMFRGTRLSKREMYEKMKISPLSVLSKHDPEYNILREMSSFVTKGKLYRGVHKLFDMLDEGDLEGCLRDNGFDFFVGILERRLKESEEELKRSSIPRRVAADSRHSRHAFRHRH